VLQVLSCGLFHLCCFNLPQLIFVSWNAVCDAFDVCSWDCETRCVNADIKRLYHTTGVKNRETVFLFLDTQIVEESFVEDINNVLSSGEVSNLYKSEEFEEVGVCTMWEMCVRRSGCSVILLSRNLRIFWSYSESFIVVFVQQIDCCLEITDLAAHCYMDIFGLHFLLFKYCLLRFRWLRSIHVTSCCRYVPNRLHSSLTTTDAYSSSSSAYAGTTAVKHDWPHAVWRHCSAVRPHLGKSRSSAVISLLCLQTIISCSAAHMKIGVLVSRPSFDAGRQWHHISVAVVRHCPLVVWSLAVNGKSQSSLVVGYQSHICHSPPTTTIAGLQ